MGRKPIAIILCLLAVVVAAAFVFMRGRDADVEPEQAGVIVSPDRTQGVRIVQEAGVTRVWLESYRAGSRTLVADLGMEQSATNAQWSPDGRLVAFQTFDNAGHSPMTTSRVWVVDARSPGIRKLRLPPPNERFSTYLDGWTSANTLRLRTTLLDRPEDVFFVYSFAADEVHPAG